MRELIETGRVDPEPHGNDVVFVVGLPGTGLSSLRRMLSHHPAFNIPTLREILSPTTDRGAWADTGVLRGDPFEHALWARLGEHGSHRTPTLEAPSSDHLLLAYAFHTPPASLEYRIPGYADWLREQDAAEAYRFHREALSAILERVDGGTPLLVNEFRDN
ncbi:sulfotransferase [Streptomyces sp. NPDC090023]|uniref:sulfotransferase n=1 Tax=unclassified Streptomyces TaxID=2593676 RepID=UPI0038079A09